MFTSNTLLSVKSLTYRLLACNFVRNCFAKISCRKFPNNLKSAIVQSTSKKNSYDGVHFNEIPGIDFRPATSVKKRLHPGGLPVSILELSTLLQEGLT